MSSHSKDGIGIFNPGRGLDSPGLLLLLLLLLRDFRIHQGLLVSHIPQFLLLACHVSQGRSTPYIADGHRTFNRESLKMGI